MRENQEAQESAVTKQHGTFDPNADPVCDAIVAALAGAIGSDPGELEPLESVVDPHVFDVLMGGKHRPVRLSFDYHDHEVTVDTDGEIWAEKRPETEPARTEHRFDADESPSQSVVRALADRQGVDPIELGPLYDFVDPDALDAMFETTTHTADRAVHVSFRIGEFEIEVTPDRYVTVQAVAAAN